MERGWKKEGTEKHSPSVGHVGLDLQLQWESSLSSRRSTVTFRDELAALRPIDHIPFHLQYSPTSTRKNQIAP